MTQVNLHCHSEHSFLDGFASVTDIARRVREVGSDAVALTDHNEVNGHYAFQKACRKEGVHPILGIEADWVSDIAWTRENLKYPSNRSHICLLAADNTGLENLWALSSIAYTDQYRYHKPLLDPDLMRRYSDGIYASDGCMITQFSRYVEAGDDVGARQQLGTLLDIYRDRFYMELHTWQFMDADTDEKRRLNTLMTQINQAKVRFAAELGVPLVVVNDSHHASPQDWENKELVWDFNTRKNPDQAGEDYGQKADHLMGAEEVYKWMGLHGISADVVDEAIKNASLIAHSCTAEITPTLTMPRLTDTEADDIRMLIDLCEEGFRQKVTDNAGTYYERMEEELRLIVDKRFAGYFLVVRDYVHAAKTGAWSQYVSGGKKNPMLVGPGRGSAGGSLVAYLLGITTIDPIRYGLLFSRFLSAGRKGYPDIDCDFPQSLRPGLKDYLAVRYGQDHVCAIGTLTRSQPKAILKDLGRAMGIPMGDQIAMSKIIEGVKTIESDAGDEDASWGEVVERKGGALSTWAKKYPELFEKINEMSGIVRQAGVHPSGIVVSNKPLLGSVPTRMKNNTVATQFDMNEVEELGAIKLDLLGLRHLDTLMTAQRLVYDRHDIWLDYTGVGDGQPFGPEQFADPAIWDQIDKGQTAGIFQMETPELTRLAVEMRPRNETDVAALLSIVRPGVKDAHLDKVYLKRRQGIEPVSYEHPAMKDITGETYGILVYQEQMMQAARTLAGFTADEADDLRKILGKKKIEELATWEGRFIQGCLDNPVFRNHFNTESSARQVISHIWASISAAGRYSFNKSHAVGYAIVSCWEIWTKHYFPQEYIVALMATDSENINRYLREARRRNIKVLPPDINLSGRKFTLGDNAIRYGLDTIRGVGSAAVTDILASRPYDSFADFLNRINSRTCGKTQVEALIKIGAFDSLKMQSTDFDVYGDRTAIMTAYHDHRILDKVAPAKLAKMDAHQRREHVSAWRAKNADKPTYLKEFTVPDFADEAVVYQIEQELVGNYVTIDPMMKYLGALEAVNALRSPLDIEDVEQGGEFTIGGQVSKLRVHTIQKAGRYKGKTMAFITVNWNDEEFEVTAFPDTWASTKLILAEGAPVACTAIRDERGSRLKSVERLDLLWSELRSGNGNG